MKLAIVTATMGQPKAEECIASWGGPDSPCELFIVHNDRDNNLGVLASMQRGYEQMKDYDIIAFYHDDLQLNEAQWWERVLAEFADPSVGVVGFGGALQHGSDDIYKTPYHYTQLGRSYYRSNVDDAEVHGERFTGACDAATLDGFALIVRRELLDKTKGWPLNTDISYVGYDYWLTLMARRLGYRVRLVGVRCHHWSGLTAVGMGIANNNGDAHEKAHVWLYEKFRGVLPVRIRDDASKDKP